MATAWIMSTVNGYVSPIVNKATSTAGTFAGDTIGAVGNGINGVGSSIESTVRSYGDSTKDYGNAVKDWSKADGIRQGTAGNPLGLSDTSGAGKRALGTSRYKAPQTKKATPALPSATQPKALPAPTKRATTATSARPQARAPAKPSAPALKDMPLTPKNPPSTIPGKKTISSESRPEGVRSARQTRQSGSAGRRAANGSARSAPASAPAKKYQASSDASNPLGL